MADMIGELKRDIMAARTASTPFACVTATAKSIDMSSGGHDPPVQHSQNSIEHPCRRHARNHRLEQAEGLPGPQIHAGRGEADVLAVQHVQHFDEQGDAARAAVERPAEANVEARVSGRRSSFRVSLTKYWSPCCSQ